MDSTLCGYVHFEIGEGGKVITPYTLTTHDGQKIGDLIKIGESFFGHDVSGRPQKITHFGMKKDGFYWHGKIALDWNQAIRMKLGRKL